MVNQEERKVSFEQCCLTLIELLVVVGIIGILVSILLTALSRSKEKTKMLVCASNLSEIGKGFHLFSKDNGQKLYQNSKKRQ